MYNEGNTMLVDILLVEDNPADVRLTMEALKEGKIKNRLTVAKDGIEALEALRKKGKFANAPDIDLILLDLNMPRMDGRAVLAVIKQDPAPDAHTRGHHDHIQGGGRHRQELQSAC